MLNPQSLEMAWVEQIIRVHVCLITVTCVITVTFVITSIYTCNGGGWFSNSGEGHPHEVMEVSSSDIWGYLLICNQDLRQELYFRKWKLHTVSFVRPLVPHQSFTVTWRKRKGRVMDDLERERVGGVGEGSVGDALVKINIFSVESDNETLISIATSLWCLIMFLCIAWCTLHLGYCINITVALIKDLHKSNCYYISASCL